MQIKPTITKSLTGRKMILGKRAEELTALATANESAATDQRKEVAELEAEIADIDELLSGPAEE